LAARRGTIKARACSRRGRNFVVGHLCPNSLAWPACLPDTPAVKPADLLRRLRRLATKRGWDFEVVQGGRHTKVRLGGRPTAVPRHPVDLKTGTLRAILRDLGLTQADLEE
jgi:mRNA interferase HicA